MDTFNLIQISLDRASQFLNYWYEYQSGNSEIKESFTSEYIAANIVEQIARLDRLNITDNKIGDIFERYFSLVKEDKERFLSCALKGAEPELFKPLLDNILNSISISLEIEDDPDLDHDLKDQISDCLVKRDDLHLVENFVRKEFESLNINTEIDILSALQYFSNERLKIDNDIKDNIDCFALVGDFCATYIRANNIRDESEYWWLFDPLHKAEESKILSLLSLRPLFTKKKTFDTLDELSLYLNTQINSARLQNNKESVSEIEQPGVSKIYDLQQSTPLSVKAPEEYHYALAASEKEQELEAAIYVLTINGKTQRAEHHKIKGIIGPDYKPEKYLDKDIIKTLEEIPAIVKANLKLDEEKFGISLTTTTEGCHGKSIGLPSLYEYLKSIGYLTVKLPIAATGVLEIDGHIKHVDQIKQKVDHALNVGFKTVIVPKENEAELDGGIKHYLRFVSNIMDAVGVLQANYSNVNGEIRNSVFILNQLRPKLISEKIECSEVQSGKYCDFLNVSGFGDKAKVLQDYNKNNEISSPIRIQGKPNSILINQLDKIISKYNLRDDPSIKLNRSLRVKLIIQSEDIRGQVKSYLSEHFKDQKVLVPENNCEYRFDIGISNKIIVKQFQNGTLTLDGKEGELWNQVLKAIEVCSGQTLNSEVKTEHNVKKKNNESVLPSDVKSWIGVDEAGKGDYYGPLVTAAVFIDDSNQKKLFTLGIKDSKKLTDQKNIDLGARILEICRDKCYVLATMPEKYNQLLSEPSFQGNSQRLLGWQHRRAMENILTKYECQYAICDQFGSEYFINDGLKTGKGTQITIIQRPKAESDIAVAAASILARREFLLRLKKMGIEYNVNFPKGSSDTTTIIEIANILIGKFGKDVLNKVAKVHFKTTKQILQT